MPHARDHLDRHVVARLVRVNESDRELPRLEAALRETDRERAARFRFPEDRARFVLGRGLLDLLLVHYLGPSHAGLELALTAHGRPFLKDDPTVHFSITHSRNLVAVALSIESLVGIDIERVPPGFKPDELATRIFSDEDLKRFQALPASEAPRAFFRAWTGKEAHLKARGVGLFGGLKEVSIPFSGAELIEDGDWRLQPLPVPEGYLGHAAWNDPLKKLDFREMKIGDTP